MQQQMQQHTPRPYHQQPHPPPTQQQQPPPQPPPQRFRRLSRASDDYDRLYDSMGNAVKVGRSRSRSRSTSPVEADVFGDSVHSNGNNRARRVSITSVFTAIIKDEEDSLSTWLASGEIDDVNVLYKGCTANHHAAYYGRVSMLKKLRASGADFAKRNRYGETALDAARSGKHAETIAFLEA